MGELKDRMKNRRLWAAMALALGMVVLLGSVTALYYQIEKERCFARLSSYVAHLGEAIEQDVNGDRRSLEALGAVLEQRDLTDYDQIKDFLTVMEGANVITRLELLLPGDRVLLEDGSLEDMAGARSFAEEAAGGVHICRGAVAEGAEDVPLRLCVPVEQEGGTAAVLCGVMDLRRLPHLFFAQEYGESMQFYIVESGSGQFLLDTWHDTLTTTDELKGRKPGRGYSGETFQQDARERGTGTTVFRSEKADEDFYASYTPVDVEDWMVMVTVPASAAFSYTQSILRSLYVAMALLIAAFAAYFFWTMRDMRREQRASARKLETINTYWTWRKTCFRRTSTRTAFSGR